jgi:hypothetical protein
MAIEPVRLSATPRNPATTFGKRRILLNEALTALATRFTVPAAEVARRGGEREFDC